MKPTLTSRPTPALFGATVDLNTTSRELTELLDEVDTLLTRLTDAESTWSRWLTGVAPEHRSSARNMLHYWAIRQYDLRDLQDTTRFPRAVVVGSQRAARRGHVALG